MEKINMMLPKRIWKDIEGYEGIYQISNLGEVKILKTKKIKKPYFRKNCKYEMINLNKNKTQKSFLVHRLVAKTFIPNPNNYPIINHKDENKLNNCVENLEWCTQKYNLNYGTVKGRISEHRKGQFAYGDNYQAEKILCIETGITYSCIQEAADKTKINRSCISACCRGKQKTAGGFHWSKLQAKIDSKQTT